MNMYIAEKKNHLFEVSYFWFSKDTLFSPFGCVFVLWPIYVVATQLWYIFNKQVELESLDEENIFFSIYPC